MKHYLTTLPISAAQLEMAVHHCSTTLANIDLPFFAQISRVTQMNDDAAAASAVALGENGEMNTEQGAGLGLLGLHSE